MSKIKTLVEYQLLASRTCPDLPGEYENERHMNLGVITEVGEALDIFKKYLAYKKEIDVTNLGEELADISWYIVNKCRFYEIALEEDFEKVVEEVSQLIETQMFKEANLPKDLKSEALLHLIVQTYCSPSESIFNSPIVQLAILANIASWYDLEFFQILTNNINKLKVRYPEKFTEEAALNRNLDAERVELEKE